MFLLVCDQLSALVVQRKLNIIKFEAVTFCYKQPLNTIPQQYKEDLVSEA